MSPRDSPLAESVHLTDCAPEPTNFVLQGCKPSLVCSRSAVCKGSELQEIQAEAEPRSNHFSQRFWPEDLGPEGLAQQTIKFFPAGVQ